MIRDGGCVRGGGGRGCCKLNASDKHMRNSIGEFFLELYFTIFLLVQDNGTTLHF